MILQQHYAVPPEDEQTAIDALNDTDFFRASSAGKARHPIGWVRISVESTDDVEDTDDNTRAFLEGVLQVLEAAGVDRAQLD
jgi:hypothetical protein